MTTSIPSLSGSPQQVRGLSFLLVFLTLTVFSQTVWFGFVNFDDQKTVYENLVVQDGLTWHGARWALTYGEIGHGHPLTWISHMLDCQGYGLWAGGHHMTNVLFHLAAVLLLFRLLRRMTGSLWGSFFVAAVFAIHPLRAESVAWISERKDVLSAFFFMWALHAYVSYVRASTSRRRRYAVVALIFALGLLSKNMVVTLPCVLLLLDIWPLERYSSSTPKSARQLVVEKIPLFLLSAVSCVATFLVPEKVPTMDRLPLVFRLQNAVVSYAVYIWQLIFPSRLACYYPNPSGLLPFILVAGALILLVALSIVTIALRRKYPYLLVGWLWYLGMTVPVIGLVQFAKYSHADRYTYLPQIGLVMALTWAMADMSLRWRARRIWLGGFMAVLLITLAVLAAHQTAYWRGSEPLWRRALAIHPDNSMARFGLATEFLRQGRVDDAIVEFEEAIKVDPRFAKAFYNLGGALCQQGRFDEAIVRYEQALRWQPDYVAAYINLGAIRIRQGRMEEAIAQFEQALRWNPDHVIAHFNLGATLHQEGRIVEAMAHYTQALRGQPDHVAARANLAAALVRQNRPVEAMVQYEQALQLNPNSPAAYLNAAWLLATHPDSAIRNGGRAVDLAQQACERSQPDTPDVLDTLAAAYAEAGRFTEAVQTARRAEHLARARGEIRQASAIELRAQQYEKNQPYRAPAWTVVNNPDTPLTH